MSWVHLTCWDVRISMLLVAMNYRAPVVSLAGRLTDWNCCPLTFTHTHRGYTYTQYCHSPYCHNPYCHYPYHHTYVLPQSILPLICTGCNTYPHNIHTGTQSILPTIYTGTQYILAYNTYWYSIHTGTQYILAYNPYCLLYILAYNPYCLQYILVDNTYY